MLQQLLKSLKTKRTPEFYHDFNEFQTMVLGLKIIYR